MNHKELDEAEQSKSSVNWNAFSRSILVPNKAISNAEKKEKASLIINA